MGATVTNPEPWVSTGYQHPWDTSVFSWDGHSRKEAQGCLTNAGSQDPVFKTSLQRWLHFLGENLKIK